MTDTGFSGPEQVDAAQVDTGQVDTEHVDIERVEAAEVEAEQVEAARVERAARRSRKRRNVLRWTGALVLALVVGGGIAYAISLPQRTDIPGLRTASDGRYTFPTLSLPTLPAGQPAPSASANKDAQQHLADIRQLLLPHPVGATVSGAKASGWFDNAYTLFSIPNVKSTFVQYGLRHTATTAWTTTDGATTKIYLLQFSDGPAAGSAEGKLSQFGGNGSTSLSGAVNGVPPKTTPIAVPQDAGVSGDYSVVKAVGKTTRYGAFVSGDVIALVIQSGPPSLMDTPFLQTLTLQAELLQ